MKLPDIIISEQSPRFKTTTFLGYPIEKLDKQSLMATICMLGELHENDIANNAQMRSFNIEYFTRKSSSIKSLV